MNLIKLVIEVNGEVVDELLDINEGLIDYCNENIFNLDMILEKVHEMNNKGKDEIEVWYDCIKCYEPPNYDVHYNEVQRMYLKRY